MIPKVSVIVPVYNTSKYLHQCLDCLAVQTLQDIEFIIVDDGSTDNSGIICDAYSKKDFRFKVIHQSNGGLAAARETGLKNAVGDFIIVCDSDDWAEPTMYEMLYNKIISTDADIVTCGFFTEYDNGKQSSDYTIFQETNGIVENDDLLARGAGWSWVKLIKRSLFEKANIHYEPGINLSEDSLIVYKLMKNNPKVVQIDQPLYHYRRVFGGVSYTNNLSMKHIHQLDFTYHWLKENYGGEKWTPIVRKRAVDLAFACLRVKDLDVKYFKQFLKEELSYNNLISKLSLKNFVILGCKILPLSFIKSIVNILYPFFYS